MKTKEFEKAIDALNLGIVIDEMKLCHSNVRQVIGHQGSEKIVWDEKGRAFTTSLKKDKREIYITPNEDGVWEQVKGYPLNRNECNYSAIPDIYSAYQFLKP